MNEESDVERLDKIQESTKALLNLKEVDITMEKDWEELANYLLIEEEDENGEGAYENLVKKEAYPLEKARALLSKMNVVVGFGRGFWSGYSDYHYIVYHREHDQFYWYLRDSENEQVHFYEMQEDAPILKLLKTKSIQGNYYLFDEVLKRAWVNELASRDSQLIGFTSDVKVEVSSLFGEDSEGFRLALMGFTPGACRSHYPHKEFEERFYQKALNQATAERVEEYNQRERKVFMEGQSLFIRMDGDVYELIKTEKSNDC